jgi:WD40 repeat protein
MNDDTPRDVSIDTIHEILDGDDTEARAKEVAEPLADPETAVHFCREHGPTTYADLLERACSWYHATETGRATAILQLARIARMAPDLLRDDPDRLVELVDNYGRWLTGEEGRFADFDRALRDEPPHVDDLRGEGYARDAGEELEAILSEWRDWADAHLDRPRLVRRRVPRDLPDERFRHVVYSPEAWSRLTWSPEGDHLVTWKGDGTLQSLDPETVETQWSRQLEGRSEALAYNDALDALVAIHSRLGSDDEEPTLSISLLELDSGERREHYRFEKNQQTRAASIARRAPRALIGGAPSLDVVNLETGGRRSIQHDDGSVFRAAIDDDGHRAAIGLSRYGEDEDGGIFIADLEAETGQPLDDLVDTTIDFSGSGLAWSDDRLAVVDGVGDVRIWDLPSGERVETFSPDHRKWSKDVTWSPSGEQLAVCWGTPAGDRRHAVTLWTLEDDETPVRLPGGIVATRSTAFDPGGRCIGLACIDGRLRIQPTSWRETDPLLPAMESDSIHLAALEPHRSLVAAASSYADEPIYILDLDTGRVVDELSFGHVPDHLDFSSDGERLLARSEQEAFQVTLWEHDGRDDWERVHDPGADGLEGFDLGSDEEKGLASRVTVDDDGATHLPNPLNPDETLTWPTPLLRMDGLDAVYLAEDCPYVVAHQCNRLEVMEVVE